MPSERVQRRIDALLDEADAALTARDWQAVLELTAGILDADPGNEDALTYRGMAEASQREPGSTTATTSPGSEVVPPSSVERPSSEPASTPTSFANDRYQVSKFLGEGGKKRVFQAHDTLLDRDIAFALIKTDGLDDASRSRITREAQAMGRLGTHPNIVTVFDLGTEDNAPFMVTELMGGGDVEGLLEDAEDNRLSLDQTIEMGKAICEGLQFAHAQGVIHRDIKPGNVWLTSDGIAKIGDFGLAVMTDRSRLTQEGMMVGTVSYMPPEQATGGDITPGADLYSLGAMLYEMVTGRPPFLGDDEIAIIGQHINTPPVAPTWHNGSCPRPLEALIMRLLSKDPSERPESAQDVLNALDAIDLTARGETVEREANSLESLAGGVFVGRQAEMDQLKGALEDVLGGRGRLVTLVGEPGIGKTRISEELATYAGMRGAKVLWGRCYEGGGAPPYWPWVQAIRSYVRDIDADELRRQMGSSASVIAEIVTDVKDRLPELPPPPQIDDPDSARFRLFDSITSFLKTASQSQAIVIVLDDLHWSDQPTLAFLEFIAREMNQSRVLLICTYRDMELNRRHPLSVTLGDLARDRLYERVVLRGLSESDIARFVEIAAGFSAPAELSATVQRHTEGNPLFVTEVIRDLIQSGELTEEKVSGRSSWSVRIPEGVREVIGRRLDRLSDRANEIFTVAAVVGREFTLDALKELSEDTTEGQLLDVLDEALDSKLIEELPDEIGRYQFTHALVQETLTSELSSARKVRLHARIAETLERLYGDRADEHAVELVPHFAEAEPVLGTDKLVRYSTIAGRRALDTFAYEAGVSHLSSAASALEDGPMSEDVALILSELGMARIAVNDEPAAIENLTAAFDYYIDNGFDSEAIEIAARPHNIQMLAQMAPVIHRGIGLTAAGSHERGRLLVPFGWVRFIEGNGKEARDSFDEAISIARRQEDPILEARALAMRANADGFDLLSADSLEAASAALELALVHNDRETELRARLWVVSGLEGTGRFDESAREREKFLNAALALGHRVWVSQAANPLLLSALLRGDWDQILENADRVDRFIPADAAVTRFIVKLWTGDFDNIKSDWGNLVSAFSRSTNEAGVPLLKVGLIPTFHGLDVASTLDQSNDLNQQILRTLVVANQDLLAAGGGVLKDFIRLQGFIFRGQSEGLGELFEALRITLETASNTSLGPVHRTLAGALVLLGDRDRALGYFDEGIANARNRQHRLELARCLADSAEVLRARGEDGDIVEAERREEEALSITQELGMRPLTERILARREILRA